MALTDPAHRPSTGARRAGYCIAIAFSAVLAAAASPRLLRAFDSVGTELRLLIAQLRPAYRGAQELAAEHAVLFYALQAGKIRPALEAWQEHIDIAEQFFLDLIKERDL